jgi:hypothetical protein
LIDGALDGVGPELIQDRILDVAHTLAVVLAELVVEEKILGIFQRGLLRAALLATVGVDVGVGQDLEQPGAKICARFEPVVEAVRANEGVLYQIFGV